MSKLIVINSVWASVICGMLAFAVVLYGQKTDRVRELGSWPVAMLAG